MPHGRHPLQRSRTLTGIRPRLLKFEAEQINPHRPGFEPVLSRLLIPVDALQEVSGDAGQFGGVYLLGDILAKPGILILVIVAQRRAVKVDRGRAVGMVYLEGAVLNGSTLLGRGFTGKDVGPENVIAIKLHTARTGH